MKMKKSLIILSLACSMNVNAIESNNIETKEVVEASKFQSFMKDVEIMTEVNLFTVHTDAGYYNKNGDHEDYNEDNELYSLGVRYNGYTLGFSVFDNSYGSDSEMYSFEYDLFKDNDMAIQIGLALVTGYDEEIVTKGIFLSNGDMIAPLVAVKYTPEFLRYNGFQLAPKVRLMGLDAFMLNLELSYKF